MDNLSLDPVKTSQCPQDVPNLMSYVGAIYSVNNTTKLCPIIRLGGFVVNTSQLLTIVNQHIEIPMFCDDPVQQNSDNDSVKIELYESQWQICTSKTNHH